MSTTTTTEISSNSNSSCRLLHCLNSLPFHDQRHFRNLFSYIDFVRLSACSRSLTSNVRNDRALWQALYHRDFLSGAYYAKEMEFVLWCVRTDVNNPCTSDKRADLLENVDWYNTYRRRVGTENNWRYKRCRTTRIAMEQDGHKLDYNTEAVDNSLVIIQQTCLDEALDYYYTIDYLPHSNLKSSKNIVYGSTFSTSPNILSLDGGNDTRYTHVLGDHYIAVFPKKIKSSTDYNVKILTRKHGGVFTTFDIPARYKVRTIDEKWVLLVGKSKSSLCQLFISDIRVFDIENNTMCPGSIDDTWNAKCFYKTVNDTAIVYTVRLAVDDETECIEWALYQFSSNNPVVQLRSGSFELPDWMLNVTIDFAQSLYDSHMLIGTSDYLACEICIMHSVASSGRSHTPRNCYDASDEDMPISLLRAGCDYFTFGSKPTKIWTDLPSNNDQILQIPDTAYIQNIIGDLYIFTTYCDYMKRRLLININTKKVICRLKAPARDEQVDDYAMVGTAYSSNERHTLVIHEYGEL